MVVDFLLLNVVLESIMESFGTTNTPTVAFVGGASLHTCG